MSYYDGINLSNELAKIPLQDRGPVPAPFERNVANIAALMDVWFISIYGQAQETLRALAAAQGGIYSHEARRKYAEVKMVLVNPYLLCEQGLYSGFMPDEMLKLMYLLGNLDAEVGRPVVEADSQQALSPENFTPTPPDYFGRYLNERNPDENFFDDKRKATDDMQHKYVAMEIKAAYLLWKYLIPQKGCGLVVTPETHPIWKDANGKDIPVAERKTAPEYWEEHKPAGYTPRPGAQEVVWNCR